MSGSTFGTFLRLTTAGESHGPGYVGILDGVPSGLELSVEDLLPDLRRRRPGQSSLTSARDEPDVPVLLSGVYEGKTTGTPIAIRIDNRDQRPRDYSEIAEKYRPGHADFTFDAKFGTRDPRGGGRSSARETSVRVAAGAIAKKLLHERYGVTIVGYVVQVGSIIAEIAEPSRVTLADVEANAVRCPDPAVAERMVAEIEAARRDKDSVGGVAELVATGAPAGWGAPVFDKLKADLGKAMLSLPAVLGVELGAGFRLAAMRGSEANDAFTVEDGRVVTRTNRHGGILGGISSGMPIIVRCAVKPTSSLPRAQETVTRDKRPTTIETKGRHDPCLLPRFVPMGEAMMALTLADHALRHEAGR